ncbi:MAG TPA: hypothetical protein VG324_03060 [Blastocatellia bacterium]|nr:hypothetical protein [Blastocatellia bacterium]
MDKLTSPKPETSATNALFSLNDAVSLYQKQVDHTHRFWNYLWFVSYAIFLWLVAKGSSGTACYNFRNYLLAAFIGFATVNLFLMGFAHRDAMTTSQAIKMRIDRCDVKRALDPEFQLALSSLSRVHLVWPLLGHLALDAFVVFSICKLCR